MRLPIAARTDDFAAALRDLGVGVPDDPGLVDLAAAVTAAVDAAMPDNRGRTDLGEMAQAAAAEALTQVVGGRLDGLFGVDPAEVRREVGRLRTAKQFGLFARDFFARLTDRLLSVFLSMALPDQVGPDGAFSRLAHQRAFERALETHCREAAGILDAYAGEWLMKHSYESQGDITRDMAARFTAHAMTKVTCELQRKTAHAPAA